MDAIKFAFGGDSVGVTASFGIAGYHHGQEADFERLMVRADAALYSGKRKGGNRVEMPPIETP